MPGNKRENFNYILMLFIVYISFGLFISLLFIHFKITTKTRGELFFNKQTHDIVRTEACL